MKKLYRLNYDKIFGGVCAGIGEYFRIDPVIVRLIAVTSLLIFNVATIILYLVAIFIVPVKRY